jgi:polyhydroxyalkanoate synthesis regulator phasin
MTLILKGNKQMLPDLKYIAGLVKRVFLLFTVCLASAVSADQSSEIIQVKKSTFSNLVDLLVKRGVINQQEGSGLMSAAEQEAAEAKAKAGEAAQSSSHEPLKSKHISYVPEIVKQEIRDQVRAELKAEVVQEVKQDAKTEGWGVPGALPDWVAAIHPSFDMRMRFADDLFAKDNQSGPATGPFNYLQINQDGGVLKALARNSTDAYINNKIDRLRLRERFRLGFEAKISDGLKVGVRFATSNNNNPVSNNQTLGNTGQSYQFAIDRSYVQYDYSEDAQDNWLSLYAGRIINPFLSTDVVFDPDLSFEGVAGSFRYQFNRDDPAVRGYRPPNPTGRSGINQGRQAPDSVFLNLGVFPIQNVNFSSSSKWLYAAQVGVDWLLFKQNRLNFASAYYEYQNISARYNPVNGSGHEYDWTAPQFLQQGNSMVAITDSNSGRFTNNNVCNDSFGCLFGLASAFRILNITAIYDYLYAGQKHLLLTVDYAKNLGFNQQQILAEFHKNIAAHTTAYQLRMDFGFPNITRFGEWNTFFAWRYLQRDAVLDAFTDSVFHMGGTNARGWVLGSQYGIAKNTWLNIRWFSTDAIDGPRYSVDTFNLDLNVRL